MPHPRDPDPSAVPTNSLVFGYGPMLPFIAAAVGMWGLAGAWPAIALRLGVIWAAIILVFVAGVRRGFGFGAGRASTRVEIVTMLLYFVPAGAALVVGMLGWYPVALILLLLGYAMVTVLDTRAARNGDAPRHFERLRPPQMSLAMVSLAAMLFRLVG